MTTPKPQNKCIAIETSQEESHLLPTFGVCNLLPKCCESYLRTCVVKSARVLGLWGRGCQANLGNARILSFYGTVPCKGAKELFTLLPSRQGDWHLSDIWCPTKRQKDKKSGLHFRSKLFNFPLFQNVTFVKMLTQTNIRIYMYQKKLKRTNVWIYLYKKFTRMNVRINIRIENCTNIWIYLNIHLLFTWMNIFVQTNLAQTNVWIYS